MTTTSTSLYDRLGGRDGIASVTAGFYKRVLADPMLAWRFKGLNMDRLERQLTTFLVASTGGPQFYHGLSMAEAHEGLDVTGAEFDAVVAHLVDELVAAEVKRDDIMTLGKVAESLRAQIVTAREWSEPVPDGPGREPGE